MGKIHNAAKRQQHEATRDDTVTVKRDMPDNDTAHGVDGNDILEVKTAEAVEGDAVAAYLARKGVWATMGEDNLVVPRANVGYVVQRAMQLGDALQTPEVTAAFEALGQVPLPGGERFDAGCLKLVPVTTRALWHVRVQLLSATARTATVALPQKLVDDATKLRATLFKVVEYVCADDSDPDDPVTEDLASIRSVEGPRFLDLATDLSRLAAYYRDPAWRPSFLSEGVRYRAEDGVRAEALAHDILQKLRQADDTAAAWTLELHRGWTELTRTWAALRRGGGFVFNGKLDAKLPPLGALRPVRASRGATDGANDGNGSPPKPA